LRNYLFTKKRRKSRKSAPLFRPKPIDASGLEAGFFQASAPLLLPVPRPSALGSASPAKCGNFPTHSTEHWNIIYFNNMMHP
jgi:hypothetical protein